MRWNEACERFPDQWLVIQALQAYTEESQGRLDEIVIVEMCDGGLVAIQRYPGRELYFVHTARATVSIDERRSPGVRP